ncbi:MAG: AAA family ATPase [Okeania sp. SIO2C2]|uniref:AAA family ATPase n=1 Tax=Okeania sp. SIO2C2 TaxID=2607787 RepID=UPI0013B78776|nr:AAA family ATPase [Okeania sp. SIO2C2]NEP90051.1 AAA family ATPase [Okeania sp. SIO2C2]
MKIKIQNLGVLKQAEFTVADMTIICGGNNTGKTYATYALFGFLSTWKMKGRKKTSKEKEIIQQLKGAKCFVDYCQAIGKLFWEKQSFLDDYEYRFVSFKDIKISKKPTQSKSKDDIHDTPENMLKINSPDYVQFNQLIGHQK